MKLLSATLHLHHELLSRYYGLPFIVPREGRFLARKQSALALPQLEPVLKRATAGKCWGNVIEIRLLQALAYCMLQEETQALDALWGFFL